MNPEIPDATYLSPGQPSHLAALGSAPPSVGDFVGATRLDAAPPPVSSSAVPIDIQLVGELNQWQSAVRAAVLEYLWLRSVLEAGDKLRRRLDFGSPRVTDIQDDLDAMSAAFYVSPRADKDWPPLLSAALTQMRELLYAPDGPYLTEHEDLSPFRTQIQSQLTQARIDAQRELGRLEDRARKAVDELGKKVEAIFHSARDAQLRAEEEHRQQFARTLGHGIAKASIPVHSLNRESAHADVKTSVFPVVTRSDTSGGALA